ncbi:unnamed protein product [Arabis nemorensis]|uniref:Uncharacterized protein n=1 Tax=Arabis nemorensis TaxID=586526 RepID=A0A565ATA7_9BRAS|nr:unnamed protein product [Arabis nemorensis]
MSDDLKFGAPTSTERPLGSLKGTYVNMRRCSDTATSGDHSLHMLSGRSNGPWCRDRLLLEKFEKVSLLYHCFKVGRF